MTVNLLKLILRTCNRAFFLGCVFSLWTLSVCSAQEKEKGTYGKISLGANFTSLTALNEALEINDFFRMGENFLTMGLAGDHFNKRWYYGGEVYNFMINESSLDNQDAVLSFHYGLLKAGYVALAKTESHAIYPTVGLGGGFTNLKARRKDEYRPTKYWAGGFLLDMALQGNMYRILDEKKSYYLIMGGSIGYLRQLMQGWKLQGFGQTDVGIPLSPQGFYFRLTLGMGRMK